MTFGRKNLLARVAELEVEITELSRVESCMAEDLFEIRKSLAEDRKEVEEIMQLLKTELPGETK